VASARALAADYKRGMRQRWCAAQLCTRINPRPLYQTIKRLVRWRALSFLMQKEAAAPGFVPNASTFCHQIDAP
jgi:hypothetical protein